MAIELYGEELQRYLEIHAARFDRRRNQAFCRYRSGIREIRREDLVCDEPEAETQFVDHRFRSNRELFER